MSTTVTFQADEILLEAARSTARRQRTTLEQMFHAWLEQLGGEPPSPRPGLAAAQPDPGFGEELVGDYREFLRQVQGEIVIARRYSREEMNAR